MVDYNILGRHIRITRYQKNCASVDLRMCLVLIVGQFLAYLIAHLDLVVDE